MKSPIGIWGYPIMRSPSRPFFKAYEIAAIVVFVAAAIAIGSLKLVY